MTVLGTLDKEESIADTNRYVPKTAGRKSGEFVGEFTRIQHMTVVATISVGRAREVLEMPNLSRENPQRSHEGLLQRDFPERQAQSGDLQKHCGDLARLQLVLGGAPSKRVVHE